MKKTITAIAALLTFSACSSNNEKATETNSSAPLSRTATVTAYPGFISIDSANKMLNSYVVSINYANNDTDLRSITFDANELRALLDSPAVTKVQIRFAHTLSYINSGHQNIPAGYKSGALTLLINGVNDSGNTVLYNNAALNFGRPCPNTCPTGTAATPLY